MSDHGNMRGMPGGPGAAMPAREGRRARVDAEHILNSAFDGTLDAAGHMRFAELLRSDPKFRARWAHTARALARLRAEGPEPRDLTDQIVARVHGAGRFRDSSARRRVPGARLAIAAGLGVALIGLAVAARMGGHDPLGAAAGPVAGRSAADGAGGRIAGAEAAERPGAAPAARRPVTRPPVLAIDNASRYDGGIDMNVTARVNSPSGGATSMRVFSAADGRVLLTDFEPYPHAQTWKAETGGELSWWVRAWTRAEPAWVEPESQPGGGRGLPAGPVPRPSGAVPGGLPRTK